MHITDPVADMLTRIRNANVVYHELVDMPLSKMRLEIARILKEEAISATIRRSMIQTADAHTRLTMNYGPAKSGDPGTAQDKQTRTPHLRWQGRAPKYGRTRIAMISTSAGYDRRAARKRGLGGEVYAMYGNGWHRCLDRRKPICSWE